MDLYEKKYKEKYEQALRVAQETYDKQPMYREWLEKMFPELKESEDERIRKWLIAQLKIKIGNNATLNNMIYKAIAWLEKQGEQKPFDEDMKTLLRTEYEKGRADVIAEMQGEWSEEDERLCQCLIKDQEKALDEVRNDKYGHSEIISDLKEMYHERIDWLESLKQRIGG